MRITTAFITLTLGCTSSTAQLRPATSDSRCAALVERYVEQEDFSGVVVMANGTGELCRVAVGKGIDATTPFPVGSLTKQMVSVAVLRAQQQGRLKLDDDVAPMLGHAHALRIVELMNHVSGLPDFTKSPGFLERRALAANAGELWEIVRGRPLRFEPGAKFEYCNSNYLALGLVLERVYGEPLEAVLQHQVFEPAGMRDTQVNRLPEHVAVGSEVKDDPDYRPEAVAGAPPALYQGAGGVVATADDLLRFGRSLLGGEHRARLDEVRAAHGGPSIAPNMEYGLGWIHSTLSGREVLWHTGTLPGFSHRIMLVPAEDLVLVALSNRGDATLGRPPKSAMGDDLFRALIGEPVESAPRLASEPPAAAELASLPGRYVAQSQAMQFEIDVVNERVYLRAVGENGKVLSPRRRIDRAAPRQFFFPRLIDAQVRFGDDRLTFTQGNEVITAMRER